MRILLTIEYNGKNFAGWQIQPGFRTVQGVLAEIISIAGGCFVELHASGRTDAGVHAFKQMVHFDTTSHLPCDKYPQIINPLLPNDVSIIKSERVDDDFHARFNVKKKTYMYKCYKSNVARPLLEDFAYRISYDVDIEKMKKAAEKLVGKHDFTSFKKASDKKKDCVRTIFNIDITESNENIEFVVCGSGFMHNMVRIIVGTLLDVGRGKLSVEAVDDMLKNKNRCLAGVTLPAHGLYLKDVEY